MPENSTDARTARGGVSRRTVLTGTLAGLMAPTAALALGADSAVAAGSDPIAALGTTRHITIYAERLASGQYGYGLAPGKATIPGPLLEMWEGDTLQIELVNNTDKRLSIHPHGVDYDTESDGSPFNASFNEPGETRTYTWRSHVAAQDADGRWVPGSAGYWHYHDHAMDGEHGTAGVRAGLYGGLVVRRKGDVLPDRTYTVVFNDMSINNKAAPNTPMFEAHLGETVEFVAIGHGDQLHTFHLHAHRWANNRTGYLTGPDDPTPVIDTRDLNPGDSFGFQVKAGHRVGAGAWMYHCHVQFHSDGGMAGIFLVRNADGSMPDGAQEAIDRFHQHGSHDATTTEKSGKQTDTQTTQTETHSH
ncbi:multicopper oxidase domain-containing protein [Promicromonospora citrea]|uniref:Copper oxidase n=1 Tax=Promicromonospora citrea TaxID=43677 RepID=A0A8H9L3U4_9MICO|nr:multicopper oxidase domain-containing protein [Promicromonospora citrea]NNH53316.1 multicopper oxidase domain-containing protein [Promicromonospora citrea]GGM23493.1 copper oxidase [Promicromonospora citrea]